MHPLKLVVVVISCVIAFCLMLDGLCTLGLYAWSKNGADTDCTNNMGMPNNGKHSISDRTAGVGLMTGGLSFLLSIFFICIYIAMLFVPYMTKGPLLIVGSAVLLFLSLLLVAAYVVSWALLAKDINDVKNPNNGGSCDTPNGWAAAISFALFGFLGWIGMAIWVCVAFAILFFVIKEE